MDKRDFTKEEVLLLNRSIEGVRVMGIVFMVIAVVIILIGVYLMLITTPIAAFVLFAISLIFLIPGLLQFLFVRRIKADLINNTAVIKPCHVTNKHYIILGRSAKVLSHFISFNGKKTEYGVDKEIYDKLENGTECMVAFAPLSQTLLAMSIDSGEWITMRSGS